MDIIEAIAKLIPFEKFGVKKEIAEPLSIIVVTAITTTVVLAIKKVYKWYQKYQISINDIKPQFDQLSISKARQYYIPTQFQNASPSRQEEPGFTHKFIARNKMIPFFLKVAFNPKVEVDRFYIILADSGMGKTTFMVNLYFSYHSFFNVRRRNEMKLLRFSNEDTIDQIRRIDTEKAKRMILLLDALDEDRGILSTSPDISEAESFRKRVDEIINLTRNFAEVVITCRTQYFPGQEDNPYELKILRPDERGFYNLNKLYISPFNDKEVKQYLDKKYGIIPFINYRRKRKAKKVISKSSNLVIRPMLLSYIDYLIEDDMHENTSYQIYETLVKKWLVREAEKRKAIDHRSTFIYNLEKLSQHISVNLYSNWKNDSRLYLTKDETIAVASQYGIELNAEEITGQSLLTCDGYGNWKFSHKSIMEFFLAKQACDFPVFFKENNFNGMDMAEKFYSESPNPLSLLTELSSPSKSTINSDIKKSKRTSFNFRLKSFYVFKFPSRINIKNNYDKGDANTYISIVENILYEINILNDKNGYINSDKEKSFSIEIDGKTKFQRKKINGFRLPTQDEWKYLVEKDSDFRSSNDVKVYFRSTVDEKSSSPFPDFNLPIEWCYDETSGLSIGKYDKITGKATFSYYLIDVKKTTGGVFFHKGIQWDNSNLYRASFHIVYVP